MSDGRRLLAVHAHPDDESSKGAATSAMYANAGVEVMVVSCTGGERGDVLNPRLQDNPEVTRDISEYRRREMAAAAEILGVQHTWLGFVDSGLPEGDPLPPLPDGCFALEPLDVTTEALVRVIREFRPHVMTTYDENGGYPHPDHVMTHQVSMAAFAAAGDPAAYPHAGEPWQPQKLYYNGFSGSRISTLHEEMLSRGLESPLEDWMKRLAERPDRKLTTRVNCADYLEHRDNALRAHATQVDPDGFWFAIPLEIQREVYPWEDWELALSLVDVVVPEESLFDGLPDGQDLDQLCLAEQVRDQHGTLVHRFENLTQPEGDREAS